MDEVVRIKVWRELTSHVFKLMYLNLFNSRVRHFDLAISFVSAFTTTGSIATWAVWKQYPLFWASVVVVSQLISVARPFLPYIKDVDKLTQLKVAHEEAKSEFEELWDRCSVSGAVSLQDFLDTKKVSDGRLKAYSNIHVWYIQSYVEQAKSRQLTYLKKFN